MHPDVKAALALAALAFYFSPVLGAVMVIIAVRIAYTQSRNAPTSHGSARLAGWRDALAGGLLRTQGLILGRADLLGHAAGSKRLLRVTEFTHLATFAPTGAGKGVSVLIPNLLIYSGSVVVSDPKGENYRTCAAWRLKQFGQHQYRLDPFMLVGPGDDSLNPLDFIADTDFDFIDRCRDLANQIVLRTGEEREPHWNDSAELIISSVIAFVCACEPNLQNRNLCTVRRILASRERLGKAMDTMMQVPTMHGLIAELGHTITSYSGDELSSVLSTVQRHTAFIDTPAVARSLATSSFDPRSLRTPRGSGVFLVLPADKLITLAPLMRLWIGTILRVTTRGVPTESNPVVFMLDEAGHLGRIQAIQDAVTLMRGYGVRLWFFFQSLNQVKDCYGNHAVTVLENIGTQQFFAMSHETAKAVSERIGDATIVVQSVGESVSLTQTHPLAFQPQQPSSTTRGTNVTRSEICRRLLKPEELATLPKDVSLIFHDNLPVVPAKLIRYYDHPEWSAAAMSSPTSPHSLMSRRRVWRRPSAQKVIFLLSVIGFIWGTIKRGVNEQNVPRIVQLQREASLIESERRKQLEAEVQREIDERRASELIEKHPELAERYRDLLPANPKRSDPKARGTVNTPRPWPSGVEAAVARRAKHRPKYDPRLPSQSGYLIKIE